MNITYEETIKNIANIEYQLEKMDAIDRVAKVTGAMYLAMHMFNRDFDTIIDDVKEERVKTDLSELK